MFLSNKKKICLIVHTAGFDQEGFRPDEKDGQLRTLAALTETLTNENIKYIIFSGGMPHQTKKGRYSLARAMDEFFIKNLKEKLSIKVQKKLSFGSRIYEEITLKNKRKIIIFKEIISVDTRENIKFLNQIIVDIEKTFKVKITPYFLSNFYHLKRISILAKQAKIHNFKLLSAEEIEEQTPWNYHKNEEYYTILTQLGFGPLITYVAKKLRT